MFFFVDSMNGYSDYQKKVFSYIRNMFGKNFIIGGGNIVDENGFKFLAEECDANFVKVGMAGGKLVPEKEEFGVGLGQVTAIRNVVKARDEFYKKTGRYIPICSDGNIKSDYQIAVALALGADYVMMGRYFAGFVESPSRLSFIKGKPYKEHWGECSTHVTVQINDSNCTPEMGIDSYIPCKGTLQDGIDITIKKLRKIIHQCGYLALDNFKGNCDMIISDN